MCELFYPDSPLLNLKTRLLIYLVWSIDVHLVKDYEYLRETDKWCYWLHRIHLLETFQPFSLYRDLAYGECRYLRSALSIKPVICFHIFLFFFSGLNAISKRPVGMGRPMANKYKAVRYQNVSHEQDTLKFMLNRM